MEQTNKDKLKFKIARGINALSNETLEYRKEAIIELFRAFEDDKRFTEEKATNTLIGRSKVASLLMGSFTWSNDIKGGTYWSNIYFNLVHNDI